MIKNTIAVLGMFFAIQVQAQQPPVSGGEYSITHLQGECVTDAQRIEIWNEIETNRALLRERGILPASNEHHRGTLLHPQFIWPVVAAPEAPYTNSWSISGHIDHNSGFPNQLQDYNCGQRTYDTAEGYNHMGVDIFTWPFAWYQMDNNQSHVVAAADGLIVAKSNGNYDRNCSFNSSNWNAVYVQHPDGSVAWYGHMKSGSLTSKSIGETVVAGEYLGVVGSSGNSTGPHLHFEVYNNLNQLIDPYAGSCNTWSPANDSWWQVQKPYVDPKINAVLTHSAPPVYLQCPTTEIPNFQNYFLPGATVITAIYLADQISGTSGFAQLLRPDGSLRTEFPVAFASSFSASWWYWTYNPSWFDQLGTWKFSFTYNGQTVIHEFQYGGLSIDKQTSESFSVAPNPTNGILLLEFDGEPGDFAVSVFDMTGKTVLSEKLTSGTVDISKLSTGVYILHATSGDKQYQRRIIKN